MATQGASSNSRLIAVGAVVLLLGVILVLLILRGTVGGQDTPAASDPVTDADIEEPAQLRPAAVDLVAEEEEAAARVSLPLDLDDGYEAVTVRATFERGVGALPTAGDRVVVYRLEEPDEDEDEADDADEIEGEEAPEPEPEADAERLLDDVEVLGVIGPRPAANEGTLTVVLAVDEGDVPGLLPVARDGHLWLTLLSAAGDATEDAAAAGEAAREADAGPEGDA